jgi:hypothetical protein
LAGKTEVFGENLPQCRFVHHKSHMLCPDANPGRRGGKPATNRLSYGTVSKTSNFLRGMKCWKALLGIFFMKILQNSSLNNTSSD